MKINQRYISCIICTDLSAEDRIAESHVRHYLIISRNQNLGRQVREKKKQEELVKTGQY